MQSLSEMAQSLLTFQPISRIRRNHGLEHATLHILSEKYPHLSMAGHSSTTGFWLLGDVPTQDVEWAVHEALRRMNNGEHNLAVHPNCGTNFVASGTLAGLAGASAMFGSGRRFRDKLERLPLAATMATIALILSQPLGLYIQEHVTTSGYPGSLEIVDIRAEHRGSVTAHRVTTRD